MATVEPTSGGKKLRVPLNENWELRQSIDEEELGCEIIENWHLRQEA